MQVSVYLRLTSALSNKYLINRLKKQLSSLFLSRWGKLWKKNETQHAVDNSLCTREVVKRAKKIYLSSYTHCWVSHFANRMPSINVDRLPCTILYTSTKRTASSHSSINSKYSNSRRHDSLDWTCFFALFASVDCFVCMKTFSNRQNYTNVASSNIRGSAAAC